MRDVTVQVAGNLGAEAAAVAKAEPKQQLEQQLESLGKFTSPGVILTLLDYKIIQIVIMIIIITLWKRQKNNNLLNRTNTFQPRHTNKVPDLNVYSLNINYEYSREYILHENQLYACSLWVSFC